MATNTLHNALCITQNLFKNLRLRTVSQLSAQPGDNQTFPNTHQQSLVTWYSYIPLSLVGGLVGGLAAAARADDHRDAAAVDEVARDVDDDEDDDEHDERDADDGGHAERQQRAGARPVRLRLCTHPAARPTNSDATSHQQPRQCRGAAGPKNGKGSQN